MKTQNNNDIILPSWSAEVTLEDIFTGKYFLNRNAIEKISWETLSPFINGDIKEILPIYYGDKVKFYKTFIDKKNKKGESTGEEKEVFVYIVDNKYIDIINRDENCYGDWDYASEVYLKIWDCSKEVFELMKGVVDPSRFLELFKREHPYLVSVIAERVGSPDTEFLTEEPFLWLIGKDLDSKLLEGEYIAPEAWEQLNLNEANAILKKIDPSVYFRRNSFKYIPKDKRGEIELSTGETKQGYKKTVEIEINIQEERIKLYYEYCPDRWEEPSLLWESYVSKKDFPLTFSYILYFINNKLEGIKNKKGVENFREDIEKYFSEEKRKIFREVEKYSNEK